MTLLLRHLLVLLPVFWSILILPVCYSFTISTLLVNLGLSQPLRSILRAANKVRSMSRTLPFIALVAFSTQSTYPMDCLSDNPFYVWWHCFAIRTPRSAAAILSWHSSLASTSSFIIIWDWSFLNSSHHFTTSIVIVINHYHYPRPHNCLQCHPYPWPCPFDVF